MTKISKEDSSQDTKNWVEMTRRERIDNSIVQGGKHSGKKVGSLSRDYCQWVLRNTDPSGWNKDIISKAYIFQEDDAVFHREALSLNIVFNHHDYSVDSHCTLYLSEDTIHSMKSSRETLIDSLGSERPTISTIEIPTEYASITGDGMLPNFRFQSFVSVSKDWFRALLLNKDKGERYYSDPISYDVIA